MITKMDFTVLLTTFFLPVLTTTFVPSYLQADLGLTRTSSDVVYNVPFPGWPGGVVPYVLSNRFRAVEVQLIHEYMNYIMDHSCVQFVDRTNQTAYLDIITSMDEAGTELFSFMYTGKRSVMIIPPPALPLRGRSVLLLTLGFAPEHTRGDRDEHIYFNCSLCEDNFKQMLQKRYKLSVDLKYPYDGKSMTHIGTEEVKNINAMMWALDPNKTTFNAKQESLSETDLKKLDFFYNCSKPEDEASSGTNGDSSGTNGDSFGTNGDSSGTNGDSSGTNGDSSGTNGDSSGTNGDSSGTNGDSSGTNGDSFGTNGDSSGTNGDSSGTNSDSSGTNGDLLGTNGDSSATNGDSSGQTGDSLGTDGDFTGTNGDSSGTNDDSLGTNGDSSGTNGDLLGTNGDSSGTNGDSSGTNADSLGTNGDSSGTNGNLLGTNGDSLGTDGDSSGTDGDSTGTSGDSSGGDSNGTGEDDSNGFSSPSGIVTEESDTLNSDGDGDKDNLFSGSASSNQGVADPTSILGESGEVWNGATFIDLNQSSTGKAPPSDPPMNYSMMIISSLNNADKSITARPKTIIATLLLWTTHFLMK